MYVIKAYKYFPPRPIIPNTVYCHLHYHAKHSKLSWQKYTYMSYSKSNSSFMYNIPFCVQQQKLGLKQHEGEKIMKKLFHHGNMKHLKTLESCTCYLFLIQLTLRNSQPFISLSSSLLTALYDTPSQVLFGPKISLYKWLWYSNELRWPCAEFTSPGTSAICLPPQREDALHNQLHWTHFYYLLQWADPLQ